MSTATTIVCFFSDSPAGRAAVEVTALQARTRDAGIVLLDAYTRQPPASQAAKDAATRLEEDGLEVEMVLGGTHRSAGTAAVWLADERNAAALVLGLRRRSPVGKLVLGSDAQDALLGADCPVIAVKAHED
ncbi:universal stress protein [Egibacter rhizosphaerae]|uniref:Universal stress protein n=1 Tax=Egibacter rhizosphaerae TaxID=1670831 RepID=A0A411YBN7_9ACTN|nr:universal stress protein [Egibacter rhizosphaerae]QBI18567.1 universal stress protein [Egibacter rhizosphaerae]